MAPRLAVLTVSTTRAASIASVLTQRNDNNRTGDNLNEPILNTSNVNAAQFGLLGKLNVDGQVYAQPLYLPAVSIAGGMHNVVYVATMHNTVYAFDADNPAEAALWSTNLGPSSPASDFGTDFHDISTEVGILSTPVIDPSTNTIFVVAFTKVTVNTTSTYSFHLHALDIGTGAEKFGGPVLISASVPGTGNGSKNGVDTFNAFMHMQRPALLLANGNVYIGFASHGDNTPFNGWLLGYSATTLRQTVVVNLSPDTQKAGLWQSGAGLAADASGNIYALTGFGDLTVPQGGSSYGDSFVKISPTGTVLDYFSPSNQATLNQQDQDLGSAGVLLLPGTNLAVGGGKQGKLYLVNTVTGHMGEFNATTDNVVQEFQVTPGSFLHIGDTPIYWNGPNGPYIYTWGDADYLKQYRFANGLFNTTPASQSTVAALNVGAAFMSISANGTVPGTAILWAALPSSGNSDTQTRTGILRAFDATNVSRELWDSNQNATRDAVGNRAKFVAPTVANGKVYLATFSGYVDVYGLLPTSATPTNTPTSIRLARRPRPTRRFQAAPCSPITSRPIRWARHRPAGRPRAAPGPSRRINRTWSRRRPPCPLPRS